MEISALDISSDVGERPDDPQGLRDDLALLDVVSSANVACGGHAGDHVSMRIICEAAHERGVAIGAQVSYVDREGFGRRRLDVSSEQLTLQVGEQWTDLQEAAESAGTAIAYLRPHGALYNAALVDDEVASAVLDAVPRRVPVLCLQGTALARLAEARGHPVTGEIFADRAVTDDGLLVPRTHPRAVIHNADEVAQRLITWIGTGRLHTLDGAPVRFEARSICIHSDTPGAVAAARRIRQVVERAGARVTPFATPGRLSVVTTGDGSRSESRTRQLAPYAAAPGGDESGTQSRVPLIGSQTQRDQALEVHQYGEFSVLIDTPPATAATLADRCRDRFGGNLRQAVPTADCLLLTFATRITAADLAQRLTALASGLTELTSARQADDGASATGSGAQPAPPGNARRAVTIDVHYDGPDLREVAERLGISVDDVVRLHTAATYRVAFFGFAPGFAYLTGLPEALHLPRRDTPRASVPAGAVAIAAAYSAVYPRSSPGGWHLLGHTDAAMFDPDRDPPTLLQPGDEVHFRAEA